MYIHVLPPPTPIFTFVDLFWGPKIQKKSKILTSSLSKSKGLGPSGVLPLNAPRRVSMTQESFSPYTLILVPIVKN